MNEKKTIDDIAAELGVSKTTVSRAISGKGRISPATVERVQQYIEEHGYQPSVLARGLAQSRTFNLGVVCPVDYDLYDLQYFHRVVQGISSVASGAGYDIVLSMMEGGDLSGLRRIAEHHKADGIILTRALFSDPAADYLKKTGLPFLVIGSSPDTDLVQVDNDNLSACSELTEVLIGKGFRKLALAGNDGMHTITATRRQGFEQAHEKLGLKVNRDLVYMDVSGIDRIREMVRDLTAKKADCLICMDERITVMVQTVCHEMHVRIPEDLALASFYNSPILQHSDPAVTALDIDDRKLGSTAAQLMLSMIDGEKPENRTLRLYQVILRGSTAV